jgi:glutamate dehydrogenase
MLANGQSGQQAAENWLAAHPEATRIRRSVEEIAASGLTLAKLTVAANLLGDLVKGREGTLTTSNLEHAQL